jgi:hypothetical protein
MSARLATVKFDNVPDFDVAPRFERQAVEERFAELKDILLDELLDQTEVAGLKTRIELAANEAAGLAFTTEFPLLVFPALLEELTRRERTRSVRQQKIIAETEALLECAV